MLSSSIMLGTVTYQASIEEQASQLLCHLDEVQAFLLRYLHKCMEAELQLSNQRSLASLPTGELLDLLWLQDGASPRRLMLRDNISSAITPSLSLLPSGRDGFIQRVWQSQGPAPCICLRYQKVETNLWNYRESSWESLFQRQAGSFHHTTLVLGSLSIGRLCLLRWAFSILIASPGVNRDLCWSSIWQIFNTLPGWDFCLGGEKAEGDVSKVYKIPKARWRQSRFSPKPTRIK